MPAITIARRRRPPLRRTGLRRRGRGVDRPRPRQGRARRQGRRQARRHVVSSSTATPTSRSSPTRIPKASRCIRHSTAHLLAYAVKELFPDAQVTIGPVIEDGFYYDFSLQAPVHAGGPRGDREAHGRAREEGRAGRAQADAARRRRRSSSRSMGEHYKAEIIASIPANEDISLYREGDFIDLCRGPHVPSTGKLKVFKLMKVAGAYWRGDSRNEMLQRIYGTAWAKKEDLDAYLHAHRGSGEARPPQARHAARPLPPAGRGAGHGVLASRRAGRSGSRSSSTCAASTRTTATRRCARRRSSTARCGRSRATGRTSRRTCSRRSRRSATSRSSR